MARKVRKISYYFAIFDPAEEGGYNVSFPDFPGCVTFGKTFEEAEEKVKEILELWLEELARNFFSHCQTIKNSKRKIQIKLFANFTIFQRTSQTSNFIDNSRFFYLPPKFVQAFRFSLLAFTYFRGFSKSVFNYP